MMRNVMLQLIGLMCIVSIAGAYDLSDAPIHTQMKYSLLASSDGFDKLNQKKEETKPADKSKDAVSPQNVSVFKSALYSALLPGLGEYKLGHKTKAKYFFAAEGLSWLGFAAFKIYGNWKEEDYIRFAAEHANAQLDGKDNEFVDLVGFYESIDQYNSLGRVSDRDRPFLLDTPENHWYWESESAQRSFRDIKNQSRSAHRNADFMIGVAVFNRLVSIIDAVRDARKAKRSMRRGGFSDKTDGFNYKLSVNPFSDSRQVKLTVYTPF